MLLSTLVAAGCTSGAVVGEFPPTHSLALSMDGLPTDPFFGPHGIFALERGPSDGEGGDAPAGDANACGPLKAKVERLRLGLQDTVEFRALVKEPEWIRTSSAITAANQQECSSLVEGDDCGSLTTQVAEGYKRLQALSPMTKVQSMSEYRDLRGAYWAWMANGCGEDGAIDGSGGAGGGENGSPSHS